MFLTLELEDLVPNALIELTENNVSRTVSYQAIDEYGKAAAQELNEMNIRAIILMHRDKTLQFEDDYKGIFDFFDINNMRYVKLKDNISTNYLRKHFRVRQSLDALTALTSDNSRQALGINMKK